MEKVKILRFRKKKGWMYYVDSEGDVSRFRNNHPGYRAKHASIPMKEREKVIIFLPGERIQKESGWLYYIDKDGDISRSPAGRRKR